MPISYEVESFSQNSIYSKLKDVNCNNRKFKVYFSTPDKGVNEDTGLLLFIAGFGGQATSNVYKKMREKFADDYNLVTIQCDYFGYEFMQSPVNVKPLDFVDINKLKQIFSEEEIKEIYKSGQFDVDTFSNFVSKYNINIRIGADLSKECLDNFNDMGLLQSIDNITAVLNVMNILYDNNLIFNSKKVIIYGHSHGAYLAYMCNAFAPKLFSLIIDNSAWVYPMYFDSNRSVNGKIGDLTIKFIFDYFAKKVISDREILKLPFLYSKFHNKCNIISYHGITDNKISCDDKLNFCNSINNCIYNEISQHKVDNIIFKSTNHGLDADFIELFNFTMNKFNPKFKKGNLIDLTKEIIFMTSKNKYIINYENIIPQINIYEL